MDGIIWRFKPIRIREIAFTEEVNINKQGVLVRRNVGCVRRGWDIPGAKGGVSWGLVIAVLILGVSGGACSAVLAAHQGFIS